MNIKNLISELKRRNVFRVATAYAIAGWLIIQIVSSVFPIFDFPEWTSQFVVILVMIGFPISLIFAWAFELTPDGIKKSREVDIEESVTKATGKKINGLIITALSVAVVFLVVERVFFAKSAILDSEEINTVTTSIAVLPFVNMSSDPENEYFSDGLSDEILNSLVKVKDMQVAGRTSSFKFKGQNENLKLIADELNVEYILEGSVRKSANLVRITAQLIKADDGYHLWSEAYERELTTNNIFDIQQEISGHVMEELKIRLLPEEEALLVERPTDNIEAYEYYLKATQLEKTLDPAGLQEAIDSYEKAVEADPDFAEAHARMAVAYVLLFSNGNITIDDTREKMKESIDRALLSDMNSGTVYLALSFYHGLNGDIEKSEEAITKAAEMLPNDALVMTAYAQTNNDRYRGDGEHAERINKAYELDPEHPFVATEYARYLYWIDQFEESMKLLDRIIDDYPDYTQAYDFKIAQLEDAPYGQIDEAFKMAYELYQKYPEDINMAITLTQISNGLRLFNISRSILEKAQEVMPNNPGIYSIKQHLYLATVDTTNLEQFREDIMTTFKLEEKDVIYMDVTLDYIRGDFEGAQQRMERVHPELTSDDTLLELPWQYYIIILTKNGENERARRIASERCSRFMDTIEPLPNETYRVNDNWVILGCQTLKGEFEEAKETLRTLYFDQNSKANWDYFNTANLTRRLFLEKPLSEDLVADIELDIERMQRNVIQYLKAEGEWKEEWEVTE